MEVKFKMQFAGYSFKFF